MRQQNKLQPHNPMRRVCGSRTHSFAGTLAPAADHLLKLLLSGRWLLEGIGDCGFGVSGLLLEGSWDSTAEVINKVSTVTVADDLN